MQRIDPDVQSALQTVFAAARSGHAARVRAKHKRDSAAFETQVELLIDECEKVLDPKHPAFPLLVMTAALRRVQRTTEPEYKSCLEFPEGW